jgi:hypothetical protein
LWRAVHNAKKWQKDLGQKDEETARWITFFAPDVFA